MVAIIISLVIITGSYIYDYKDLKKRGKGK